MAMTERGFVELVAAADPALQAVVDEHRRTYDDVFVHVLCGDLARYCVAAWERGDADVAERCLTVVAAGLDAGDEAVKNAIQASFVENVGPCDPHLRPFIDSWPPSLRAEAKRQATADQEKRGKP